jgi:hypothetical protein
MAPPIIPRKEFSSVAESRRKVTFTPGSVSLITPGECVLISLGECVPLKGPALVSQTLFGVYDHILREHAEGNAGHGERQPQNRDRVGAPSLRRRDGPKRRVLAAS